MATPAPPSQSPVTVAWINNSYENPGSGQTLSDDDAAKVIQALNIQNQDMVAAWGSGKQLTHLLAGDAASAPAGAVLAYFLYNADAAGMLGYHDTDPNGNPFIRVFVETILSNGGTSLAGSVSVSVCAGHEADEEAADPSCLATATAPDGSVWALEVCDPVESSSYNVTLSDGSEVAVSNFVYPSFFENGGQPPFDHLGIVSGPFTLVQGGYAIINGQPAFGSPAGQPVSADRMAAGYPEWRWQMKLFPRSRTARRLRQTR
jgi:hypothetical protein